MNNDDDVLDKHGYEDEADDEPAPRSPGEKPEKRDEEEHEVDEDRRSEPDEDEDETAEEKRDRRRRERQRKAQARDRDRRLIQDQARQIAELRSIVGSVAQRITGQDAAAFEGAVNAAKSRAAEARASLRKATEAGDPDAVVEATEALYSARQETERLEAVRRENAERPRQDAPRGPDVVLKAHYDDFVSRHDWFDPNGDDEDSAEARRIDQRLARSGSDPRTPEHWRRLEGEIRKKLPHLFEEDEPKQRPGRPPVGGSGRDAVGRRGSDDGWVLSRARKQAMIENGAWDDPVRHKNMIAAYKDYDRKHSAR